jgi:hypothetical protein
MSTIEVVEGSKWKLNILEVEIGTSRVFGPPSAPSLLSLIHFLYSLQMSSALPGPPKHRASAASKSYKQPVGLAYEGRIKWNVVILVSQLFLAQIGIWGLFRNLLDRMLGRTLGGLIGMRVC